MEESTDSRNKRSLDEMGSEVVSAPPDFVLPELPANLQSNNPVNNWLKARLKEFLLTDKEGRKKIMLQMKDFIIRSKEFSKEKQQYSDFLTYLLNVSNNLWEAGLPKVLTISPDVQESSEINMGMIWKIDTYDVNGIEGLNINVFNGWEKLEFVKLLRSLKGLLIAYYYQVAVSGRRDLQSYNIINWAYNFRIYFVTDEATGDTPNSPDIVRILAMLHKIKVPADEITMKSGYHDNIDKSWQAFHHKIIKRVYKDPERISDVRVIDRLNIYSPNATLSEDQEQERILHEIQVTGRRREPSIRHLD